MARKKKTPPGAKKRHDKNVSSIDQHKRQGKQLVTPFMSFENLKKASWVNERLPEMLWALLLIAHLDREEALSIFRNVAKYAERFREREEKIGVTHTELSLLSAEHINEVLKIILADDVTRAILRPLLLLDNLPAYERWQEAIGKEKDSKDWELLMTAVGRTLNHQSQEATDCRWLKVLVFITSGRLKYLPHLEDSLKGILRYPDYGDMRRVRPHIRAAEIGLMGPKEEPSEWSSKFWDNCMACTPCVEVEEQILLGIPKPSTTLSQINDVVRAVIDHCYKSRRTTAVDAKYDAVFGIVLYSLFTLRELLRVGMEGSILGRMGLRSLTEAFITLSYLVKKNDDYYYLMYRNYGAGQAKLAWLKLVEEEKTPDYIDLDTLEALATEDAWFEFINIDLGQWAGTDLRKMSVEASVKDDYDKYYSWTSGFIHGQWGAIRDTAFHNCFNPLHRMHRIPRESARRLNDVVPDACYIVDKILEVVSSEYPGLMDRVTLKS